MGQNQDSLDTSGFFDHRKAFSGQVTQVQMWNVVLNPTDIKDLATCKVQNVFENQEIVQWNNLQLWELSNVTTTEVNLGKLCTKSPLLDRLIWLKHVSYDHIFELCNTVEGKLPIIKSVEDNQSLENKTTEVLQSFRATGESRHYLDKCISQGSKERAIFWLAQNKINRSTWINPYDQTD